MKKIVMILIALIFTIPMLTSAKSYVNSEGVEIPENQYNSLIEIGLTKEQIDSMPQETYDTYGDIEILDSVTEEKFFRETTFKNYKKDITIVEEITEYDYDNEVEADISSLLQNIRENNRDYSVTSSHETSYKKLTGTMMKTSTVYPNKRSVIATLTWKRIPAVKSYDIFAARTTNGLISLNSYSGSMTSTQMVPSGATCTYSGTQNFTSSYSYSNSAWNVQNSGVAHSGVGFTSLLKDKSTYCIYDAGLVYSYVTGYNASLTFNGAADTTNGQLTAYISYQHATTSVSYNSVYQAYTFSNSGLGHVIYFSNNTLMSSYDGMGGITLTL